MSMVVLKLSKRNSIWADVVVRDIWCKKLFSEVKPEALMLRTSAVISVELVGRVGDKEDSWCVVSVL